MDGHELSTHPEFPPNYPLDAIKSAMKTIMRTEHFEFGEGGGPIYVARNGVFTYVL